MNNGIITTLRTRYLDLVNREADWSTRYGKNHIAVVNLRNQIRDIRRSIRDELGRIEETTKSELEIAQKRQDELEKSLAGFVSQSTETNQAQITLFSLEATAQSYRKIYDSFLQRHTEAVQQQSYPISDARVISPAAGALKSNAQPLKIWATTVLAGGLFGLGLGLFREKMDRRFRTREQVQSILDTDCLAMIPMMSHDGAVLNYDRRALPRKAELIGAIQGRFGPKSISSAPKILQSIIDSPDSPYAEAIRSLKFTVNFAKEGKRPKVIGLTSSLPSEGKSTIAAALAMLMAQSGLRVALVDCDLRNPSLSRLLAPNATTGFPDVVGGKASLTDAVWFWGSSTASMTFLPSVIRSSLPNVTEILASDAAKTIFEALELKYDYVIVDLPPLVAPVDVRVAARLVDSYVLVIEWGATKVDAVQYALRHAPDVQQNIVGAVLNKVDMAAMSRYDSYGAAYYYRQNPAASSTN
jgi:succinoglycan biosynthesis transport protein ExoP